MLQAVTGVLEPLMELLLDGYCRGGWFEAVAMLVDVGGSSGAFLAMIMSRVPTIRQGLNFDLPDVVAAAPHITCETIDPPIPYPNCPLSLSLPSPLQSSPHDRAYPSEF